MKKSLLILGGGAVTPVGLSSVETCASIRARISAFTDTVYRRPPAEPILGARVPASQTLKHSASAWLINLATRAILECMSSIQAPASKVALIICLPETYRRHPAITELESSNFLLMIERKTKLSFHTNSSILLSGHSAAIHGIAIARKLMEREGIEYCIVGGVDSLLNRFDIERLTAANRLHDERNPQGVIPGEGAAFIVVTHPDQSVATPCLASILGVGAAMEKDTVLGERFSTGRGLRKALDAALADSACEESQMSFRVSDMNGERYRAWESFISTTRFYRTRRAALPVWLPATSVGDMGVAAGPLNLLIAAMGIARGYAPGPIAVCEASSDEGLRTALIMSPAPGAASPPFLSRYGLTA